MKKRPFLALATFALVLQPGMAQDAQPGRLGTPHAAADRVVDLATREGAASVGARWRFHEARVVEVDFRAAGPDRRPSGPPNRTYDIEPRAGAADFDDSAWPEIDPSSLADRRGGGRLSFAWYRLELVVPESIDGFDPLGSTAVFEIVVDDYAEVWVDGELPRRLGQSGGSLVAGWNAPNRLVVGRGLCPGRRIQLAICALNGPFSDAPENYIWVRSAKLELYREPRVLAPVAVETRILRADPRLDAIVPPGTRWEKLAEGFRFTEGPLWTAEGALLFSDPFANRIYRWTPAGELAVFREESGYSGADVRLYSQPGSNGLALDREGRLVMCQHGNRRIARIERDGTESVLADRFQGLRLNSPNDLVLRSDGALYFTDPPYGLPAWHDDPRRELAQLGVWRLDECGLRLVSAELRGPNGLCFSPDERQLYVANWDLERRVVLRHEVLADGGLAPGELFFDVGDAPGEEALDGLKVDRAGNVLFSGPGGLWVVSPRGEHLGTVQGPELAANFAFGDADGRTLYLCARTGLYRMRLAEGSGAARART